MKNSKNLLHSFDLLPLSTVQRACCHTLAAECACLSLNVPLNSFDPAKETKIHPELKKAGFTTAMLSALSLQKVAEALTEPPLYI